MQTYIVYIGLLLFSLVFARLAEKTNKSIYVFWIVAALSFVAGFRGISVGLDTEHYTTYIQSIINGDLNRAYGLEWSFRYLCYGLSVIFKDPQAYFVLFALITNGLILWRLWDFRDKTSFTATVASYYIMFYMMSLNLMRQFIAVAILFFATRYLAKGRHWLYLLFVVFASVFHQTAFLGVLYIFMDLPSWKYLPKKKKRFLIFVLLLTPLILVQVYNGLVQYFVYFRDVEMQIGVMLLCKFAFLIVSMFALDLTTVQGIADNTYAQFQYFRRTTIAAYILGLCVTAAGYVWKVVSRVGLYFYVFEPVYFGMVFKQKNTRINFLLKLFLLFLMGYQFIGNFTANGQGQLPYVFCWQ